MSNIFDILIGVADPVFFFVAIGIGFSIPAYAELSKQWKYTNMVAARCISLHKEETRDSEGKKHVLFSPEFIAIIDGEEKIFKFVSQVSTEPNFHEGDIVTLKYPAGDLGPYRMKETNYAMYENIIRRANDINKNLTGEELNIQKVPFDPTLRYGKFCIQGYYRLKGWFAMPFICLGLILLIVLIAMYGN